MSECMAEVIHAPYAPDMVRAQPTKTIEPDPKPRRTGNLWPVLIDGIVRARRLARATMRNIKRNLYFALACNASGVPLTAGVIFPIFGILISPMLAAAAMRLSPVSVVSNALRLRTVNFE